VQHLVLLGTYCIKGAPGAAFAFAMPDSADKRVTRVDSRGLNDFLGTPLAAALSTRQRMGVMSVWLVDKVIPYSSRLIEE
jgi:hypothetical protein